MHELPLILQNIRKIASSEKQAISVSEEHISELKKVKWGIELKRRKHDERYLRK